MLRMDHVVLVVEDLPAAVAYFAELGMEQMGGGEIRGDWADRVNGYPGVHVDIVMMKAPDGSGQLELTTFHSPDVRPGDPAAPSNTLGYRSVMFEVDDLDDTVARMAGHGGAVIGEIAEYDNVYRLCYLSGPGGVIVALAQSLAS